MKHTIFIFFALSLTLMSCDSKKEGIDMDYISDSVEDLVASTGDCYKNIIILPGAGCTGCITEGESFLRENHNNKDYLFVLTKINSLKELSHKTGIDVTKYPNIYIDDNNLFLKKTRLIYPLVAFYNCDNNKVNNVKIQKPGNDAFRGL